MLTYKTWDQANPEKITETMKDSLDVIKWAFKEYGDRLVYACSFGAEGIVLIDLISKVNKQATIVFLDTDMHFNETYELIEKVKNKYPTLHFVMQKPTLSLEEQARQYGDELWTSNPNLCCKLRKVDSLDTVLSKYEAWMSGLRREQSPTRQHVNYINRDNRFQKVKICPLIHWSWEEIWNYITLHKLPYNELHDKHYPSIGCKTCTLPTVDQTDARAGRWINTNKTECGLHQG